MAAFGRFVAVMLAVFVSMICTYFAQHYALPRIGLSALNFRDVAVVVGIFSFGKLALTVTSDALKTSR